MKVSIVIPAHNNANGLELLIKDLIPVLISQEETRDFEIVVADDNSSDGTSALIDRLSSADSRIIPVHVLDGQGFGNAVRAGLKNATGEIIVTYPADGSADPGDISRLVAKIEEGNDIASGSRFCKGGSTDGYPLKDILADRMFNGSVRLLFGVRHKDTTNVFKAYRKDAIDRVGIDCLEAAGPEIAMEIVLKAHIIGLKSAEVPVASHGGHKRENARPTLYQDGRRYGVQLLKLFIMGNLVSLKDILGAVMKGSPVYMVIALLIGLLILTGVLSIAGFTRVLSIISRTSPAFLLIGCVMVLATFALRTWRCILILKTSGYEAHPDTIIKCYFFGFFVNYLLPAGIGDLMRAFALKATADVPMSVCLPTFVVEGAMDMLALAAIMVAAIMMISGYGELYELALFALLLSMGLLLGLLLLYNLDRFAYRFYDRFKPLQKIIATFKSAIRQMMKNPAAMMGCLILSVTIWLVEISSIYFASRAVHIDLSAALTLVTGASSFIAEAIPLMPAGLGIHEGAIAGVLYLFGYEVSAGTSIALVDHFARGLVIYTFGIISMIHIGFGSRRYFVSNGRREEPDSVDQLLMPAGIEK